MLDGGVVADHAKMGRIYTVAAFRFGRLGSGSNDPFAWLNLVDAAFLGLVPAEQAFREETNCQI